MIANPEVNPEVFEEGWESIIEREGDVNGVAVGSNGVHGETEGSSGDPESPVLVDVVA